jgi:flavin reductase (DIM6/NTAB) family NADH-FMN oxidoreductase RutF
LDLPWNDERSNMFITNVGLITSDGPFGANVMACEWTHHVSYSPGLVAVCIGPNKVTHENIKQTKEFGVNLCSTDQSIMSSIAGGYTGSRYNKINALTTMEKRISEISNEVPTCLANTSLKEKGNSK